MFLDISNIFFCIICLLCALIFGVIALWAFKQQAPMTFWAGSTVKPEEIVDVSAYNKANGVMWSIYTACMILAGILSLFNLIAGVILLVVNCIPGVFVLIISYRRIYSKYKR